MKDAFMKQWHVVDLDEGILSSHPTKAEAKRRAVGGMIGRVRTHRLKPGHYLYTCLENSDGVSSMERDVIQGRCFERAGYGYLVPTPHQP